MMTKYVIQLKEANFVNGVGNIDEIMKIHGTVGENLESLQF